ncbi:protein KINESIN LIGHT CHAIN-RELATED 1-like [Panicum hallii]|uniref:protein KINESIN LIGHT CHAIN-RELATED 1-like n=1 Tax=Panicum hallii TaxID=206008 RepID=UPI000DF4D724|nr:protein KINESIN LIGHT CHAIN-RELATED 1-like [Panicum hallii]
MASAEAQQRSYACAVGKEAIEGEEGLLTAAGRGGMGRRAAKQVRTTAEVAKGAASLGEASADPKSPASSAASLATPAAARRRIPRRALRQASAAASRERGGRAHARVRRARRGEGAELELAMSLHVAVAIHCSLARDADVIPVLERAVACYGKGLEILMPCSATTIPASPRPARDLG